MPRQTQNAKSTDSGSAAHPYDLLVVGGGVNGCGIARDAVGWGFRSSFWRRLIWEPRRLQHLQSHSWWASVFRALQIPLGQKGFAGTRRVAEDHAAYRLAHGV